MDDYKTKADRIAEFMEIMSGGLAVTHCEALRNYLDNMGFFEVPASTKYHGNYRGGLFDHSLAVTKNLLLLTERLGLKWERERSPYLVGMLHDICKCDQYVKQADGSYTYQNDLPLCGHGDKSVILALQVEMLTMEEIMCIRWHMGAYDDSKVWNNLGAAIETYPNVLYTHTADMMASRIDGI